MAHRTRLFVDFWNFQLQWNERTGKAPCDWPKLPAVVTALVEAQVPQLRSIQLDDTRVYASYNPDTEGNLGGWLDSFLNRQPGFRVFTCERRSRPRPIHCNGARLRLWKVELQKLADATALCISVCHFPPGTSKWNKIEHRLFSFISSNWRGEPLRDYETIVNLIAKTTTAKGLRVTCRLDRRKYPSGRTVSDEEMQNVNVTYDKFHGDWNYIICPRASRS